MLRKELEGARVAWLDAANSPAERKRRESLDTLLYTDSAGKVFDFHSLRHTFVSRIVRSGMSVKESQTLARHSDPRLTIGLYAHVEAADTAQAMAAVPGLMAPELCTNLCPIGDTERQSARASESIEAKAYPGSNESQTPSLTVICDEMRAIQAEREGFSTGSLSKFPFLKGLRHNSLQYRELTPFSRPRLDPVFPGCSGAGPGQIRDKKTVQWIVALGLALGLSLLAMRVNGSETETSTTPNSRSQLARLLEQKVVQTQEEIRQLVIAAHAKLPREQAESIGSAYARYSTRYQDSVADQIRSILSDAVQKRIFIPLEYIFFDIAVRGQKSSRKGLNALRECLRSRLPTSVFFFKTNRLFRKTYRSLQFVEEEVVDRGIRAVFVRSSIDTNERDRWRLLLNQHASIDEFSVASAADHIRSAHEGLFEKGLVHGTVTFGYAAVPAEAGTTRRGRPRCKYQVDPGLAAWVKNVFEWFVRERLTIGEIVRRLNSGPNAPTPPRTSNGQWSRNAVRRMLSNPRYRGWWSYGTSETIWVSSADSVQKRRRNQPLKSAQEESLRIVEDEIWYRAQALLLVEAERAVGRKARDPVTSTEARLTGGLFVCKVHDRPLRAGGSYGKYLICPVCANAPKHERPLYSMLPRKLAIRKLTETLSALIRSDSELVTKVAESCAAHMTEIASTAPEEIQALEVHKNRLDRKVQTLLAVLGDTEEDVRETEIAIQRARHERTEVLAKLASLRAASSRSVVVPTDEAIRGLLSDLDRILLAISSSPMPDEASQLRVVIDLITGGKVWIEQEGERRARAGWLRARMNCRLLEAIAERSTGILLSEEKGIEVSFEVRDEKEALDRELVEKIAESYNSGDLIKQIAASFQVTRSTVVRAIGQWKAARGEAYQDGRTRRSGLKRKHVATPTYQRLAEPVKEAADRGLHFGEIAREMGIPFQAVQKAWQFWHVSRELTVPDGRTRRKELRKQAESQPPSKDGRAN